MPTFYSQIASDNFRLARSKTLAAPASGTYEVIRVPQWTFVGKVWLYISTAFVGGAPTVSVGWLGNKQTAVTAGFLSNDMSEPFVAGLKESFRDSLVSFPGKWFNAAGGAVTVTVATGGATTVGTFIVFAHYSVIH